MNVIVMNKTGQYHKTKYKASINVKNTFTYGQNESNEADGKSCIPLKTSKNSVFVTFAL